MPTPRRTPRSSLGASSPVVLLPAPSTPKHYTSADLLARAEASQLLDDDDDESGPSALLSPRARRHAAFTRAREASAEPSVSGTPVPKASAPKAAAIWESPGEEGAAEASGSEGSDNNSASDSTSESGSDSSSDDDDDSSEDDDDESESDDSEDEEEALERQLAAARASAAAAEKKGKSSAGARSTALGEDDDGELKFESEESKEAPIPDLAIPSISTRHLVLADDGTAHAGEAGPSKPREGAPELDRRAYERALSKREKLARPKKATASELWATLPSARPDELPQMKRDYQALALANSLDPKRFMKGGNRAGKVPEKFAIGTMVQAPRHLQDSTVQKERKYRAGEIVASLIQDANIGSYAKRKYEDLQGKRMANGRGKGWQKRAKW